MTFAYVVLTLLASFLMADLLDAATDLDDDPRL